MAKTFKIAGPLDMAAKKPIRESAAAKKARYKQQSIAAKEKYAKYQADKLAKFTSRLEEKITNLDWSDPKAVSKTEKLLTRIAGIKKGKAGGAGKAAKKLFAAGKTQFEEGWMGMKPSVTGFMRSVKNLFNGKGTLGKMGLPLLFMLPALLKLADKGIDYGMESVTGTRALRDKMEAAQEAMRAEQLNRMQTQGSDDLVKRALYNMAKTEYTSNLQQSASRTDITADEEQQSMMLAMMKAQGRGGGSLAPGEFTVGGG